MNDEDALLAAIVAHPDEDTPRLVYADWLEEHDAPLQADFIRTQCRLAACSAADPEYPDLLERSAERVAQFGPLAKLSAPELPPGFAFDADIGPGADNFRRGFLYTVRGLWYATLVGPTDAADAEIEQARTGLSKLIATTTVRQLRLTDLTAEQIARVLAAPGAETLTGLSVQPFWNEEGGAVLRTVAGAAAVPNLERLALSMGVRTEELAPLIGAKFARLAHLDLPWLRGRVSDLRALTGAKWFRGLRSVRTGAADRALESALLTALAKLPRLESLDVRLQNDPALKALGSARGFRALARLEFQSPLSRPATEQLAQGAFPRLAELVLHSVQSYHLTTLLDARWFPQLRVLSLHYGALTDASVVALSKSLAAANLRIIRFDSVPVGRSAFAALGNGTRFPNLTTLVLNTAVTRRTTVADMEKFARTLSLPRLRHLDLAGWPLGDAGALALAANASLANLTRLGLSGCGIGDKGLTALARSPHLQQLIELDLTNNKLKTAAALRDPRRLPRLAAARLAGNPIPPAAHRKLTTRGLAAAR
ncbi:MAG: TIGR02996 domain-containing protein [Planctomycetes bacterium]|nr:TIGR02996 domain-containing protein [Planctomycetota bacterium]